MRTIRLLLLFILLPAISFSQRSINTQNSIPYIEVTGEDEFEIVPDEIFLQITLKEHYEGNNKTNINNLENTLKKRLQENNIDLDKLSLADAEATYVKIKRKNKDVLASKEYLLEISNTKELAIVWEILDEIDVLNAYVKRVDHSKIEDFEKEVKVKALKNAVEKAEYLLAAVNKKVGKTLIIQELESYNQIPITRMKLEMAPIDLKSDQSLNKESEISFQKIKLNYKVFARFAIE